MIGLPGVLQNGKSAEAKLRQRGKFKDNGGLARKIKNWGFKGIYAFY